MKKNYIYLVLFVFTTIILVVFLFIGNEFFGESKKIFSTNQFIVYKIQKFDSEEKSVSDYYYQKPLGRENTPAQFLFKTPAAPTPLTTIANGQIIYYAAKENTIDFFIMDVTTPETPTSPLFSLPQKTNSMMVNKIIYQPTPGRIIVATTETDTDMISTIYLYSLLNESLTELQKLTSRQDRLDLIGIYENKLLVKRVDDEICRENVAILHLDTKEETTLVASTDAQPICLSQLSLSESGRFLLLGNDGGTVAKNKTIKELTSIYDLKESKYVLAAPAAAPTAEYIENVDTSQAIWSSDEKSLIMLKGSSTYSTLNPVTWRDDVYLNVSADHFILGAPEWQDQKGGLIVKALAAVGSEPNSAPFAEKLLGVDAQGYFEIVSADPDTSLEFVGIVGVVVEKTSTKYQPLLYWSTANNSDGEKTVYKWNGSEVKQLFKVPATTNDIFLFNENLFTVIDAADDDAFYNAAGEKITTPPYPLLEVNKLSFGAYQTIYNTKYSTVCDNNTANCEIFNLNTKEIKTFSAATINNNAQKNYILQPLSIRNDSLILSVTTHDGAPDRSSPFKIVKVDLNQPKNYVAVWDSAQIANATANAETDIFLTNTDDVIKITREQQNPNNYHFANLTSGQTSVLESAALVSMSPSTKYLLLTQAKNSIDTYSNYDHFSIINAADGQNISVPPLDDDDQEFIFLGWENNADRDILFLTDGKRLLTLDVTSQKITVDHVLPFNVDELLAQRIKILNLIK